MKFTIICVFLYQIQFSNSISCFQCSLISSNAVHTCPSSNQDISKWKDSKDKLITHKKDSNSDSFSCIVGIDKTKKEEYGFKFPYDTLRRRKRKDRSGRKK